MFEVADLPQVFDVIASDDAELVAAIADGARFENAALARQLVAMIDLHDRRRDALLAQHRGTQVFGDETTSPLLWKVDPFAAVAAEIAAARRISRARAEGLLSTALALQNRFPRLFSQFLAGRLTYRVIQIVISRTELLDDADVSMVDDQLLKVLSGLDRLSDKKIGELVDFWVMEIDYLAVRAKRDVHKERFVAMDVREDGMTDVMGTVNTADAALLNARLEQLAATVCSMDPRSKAERCADAIGPVAAGLSKLDCQCGRDDCPTLAEPETEEPTAALQVQVIADKATLEGGSKPALLPGFGPLRADVLRGLAVGLRVKFQDVCHPHDAAPECRYQPSAGLARFVRCRDLTCRWPGCDVPAQRCQLDHTVPYPVGPTHASNVKCLCPFHHWLKTFFTGPGGWYDIQLPDGTVIWRSPTGVMYTTKPAGALYFPVLGEPTAALTLPATSDSAHKTQKMPLRPHTREQEKALRRAYEYKRNAATRPPPEPPPF